MVEPTNPKTFISGRDLDVTDLRLKCTAILGEKEIPDQIWTQAVAQYKEHMKDFDNLDPKQAAQDLAKEVKSVLSPKNK